MKMKFFIQIRHGLLKEMWTQVCAWVLRITMRGPLI